MFERSFTPTRREHWLVLAAVGVIAVHVIDDSFLQPEPGTAAGDHLVSGLVPLALLGLAAATYPRMRAGARAVVALLTGAFGIATGAEAWHYTREVGASGDDFTGLLAIPAGVLLVGIAAITLWRSRRLDESRPRRYVRRALIALAGAVVAVSLVAPVLLSYGFTHIGRAVVPDPDLGAAHRDVTFPTSDGLTLEGWYVPSRNRAAVIAFPGRKGPRRQTRMLARHGFGVLLFDRRGEGDSDGEPNALGWDGEKDLRAALAFLRRQPDVDPRRIGGIGLSVGGELLLQAAAHTDELRGVVSEGAGIRSVREQQESDGARRWLELPTWAMTTLATSVFANRGPPPNLKDLVARISPRPVFLIYAERGQGGEDLNPTYFAAAGPPRTIWKTDSGHTGGIEAEPREYERRVVAFFDRYLLARRVTASRASR